MFTKSSRYHKVSAEEVRDGKGRAVKVVKLRRLPQVDGVAISVDNSHQLDVMSKKLYKEGSKFWHIADANSALQANELVHTVGREIKLPK